MGTELRVSNPSAIYKDAHNHYTYSFGRSNSSSSRKDNMSDRTDAPVRSHRHTSSVKSTNDTSAQWTTHIRSTSIDHQSSRAGSSRSSQVYVNELGDADVAQTKDRPLSVLSRSSSSIRNMQQFAHIHRKRLSRTMRNISSFLQITVNVSQDVSFPVTVEKTFTVERLARQIEAEYAFKFCGIDQRGLYEPLEVGLLYDVGMVALRFRDVLGDVLEHGDVVHVLNIYEDYRHQPIKREESREFERNAECASVDCDCQRDPSLLLDTDIKEKEVKRRSLSVIPDPSTSDAPASMNSLSDPQNASTSHIQNLIQASEFRFQAVLSNTLAINFFQRFAIREYSVENLLFWLDVELFAAGVSTDSDEDSYFDEQQTVLVHARYIYLTYVSTSAPLQVNLSDEVRREIPWPLNDDFQVERNIFDEAQEAVYQLMKGHTFVRFEESDEWRTCLKIKKDDTARYQAHEMTESLEHYFRPSMALMLAATMALDNDTEQAPVSHHYKEQTLHSMLSQYFPDTALLDNTGKRKKDPTKDGSAVIEGYFESENRLTTTQRMRRIKKERKLQWLFGEKVSRMDGQLVVLPKELAQDDVSDVQSLVSVSSTIGSRKAAKKVWSRKKKVEKLESIFGRGLTDSQLLSQQLRKVEQDSVSLNGQPEPVAHVKSVNELSAKERRKLWKRSKKLKMVLGDALDEELVRQTVTLPVIQISPNQDRFSKECSAAYDARVMNGNNNAMYAKKRRASDSIVPPTPLVATTNLAETSRSPPVSPTAEGQEPSMTIRRSGSWSTMTLTASGSPLMVVNKDTKEYRRKKLAKLYQFLGERVPVEVITGEIDPRTVMPPPPPPPPPRKLRQKPRRPPSLPPKKTPTTALVADSHPLPSSQQTNPTTDTPKLTPEDKKRHLQRAVKLEKMFGEIPPSNLFMMNSPTRSTPIGPYYNLDRRSERSSIDIHRQSLASLGYLMDNDRNSLYDLIDYIATPSDEEQSSSSDYPNDTGNSSDSDGGLAFGDSGRRVSSVPSTPITAKRRSDRARLLNKQTRMRGIRKLSHFFGATYGQLFPDRVLGELLGDLEQEIQEEICTNEDEIDPAVVDAVMGRIEELRVRSAELAPSSDEDEFVDALQGLQGVNFESLSATDEDGAAAATMYTGPLPPPRHHVSPLRPIRL